MTRRAQGYVALAVLGAAAVTLLAVELADGALSYGEAVSEDPCTAQVDYPGEGLDPTVQRIVLAGLNGAACELEVSREELVLSLDESLAPEEIPWDRATIERSLRAGLVGAVDDAEQRGAIDPLTAVVMRAAIERAPLDFLVRGGQQIADVLQRVQEGDLGGVLDELGNLDLEDLLDEFGDLDLDLDVEDLLDDLLGAYGP